MVEEDANGQLTVIQNHLMASELSLVFFYAPWSAESHFAKNIIDILANKFSKEVSNTSYIISKTKFNIP